ncbi:MAG TPA: hypothetical protein H9888_03245 [Candidatus Rikenella faecigallinarum]|uniref:Phosphodiester glycosidase domain-containing protein n=1 Tax=Candidatus Rikenella faecigallinarum TaxID=2838745 RepID=A0A9D1QED8_9BACT|nr:hypothetical protein [Candidatus Rikenella faecigallinarum]
MKSEKEIQDDEIRVIGNSDGKRVSEAPGQRFRWWMITAAGVVIALGIAVASYFMGRSEGEAEEYDYTTVLELQQEAANRQAAAQTATDGRTADSAAYVTITEETVNDVPLYLYTPHHARPSLALGLPDKLDSTIVFVAQAADIGGNGEIIGAFVYRGEIMARALSKKGYCAILGDRIEIGVSPDTPLFNDAVRQKGYFFRQYPLVDKGRPIDNKPKGKAIRRAIGQRNGRTVMVESRSAESFHDFAEALADLGFSDAIYLVGSTAYGWAVDNRGVRHEFGVEDPGLPPTTSYIVWRGR